MRLANMQPFYPGEKVKFTGDPDTPDYVYVIRDCVYERQMIRGILSPYFTWRLYLEDQGNTSFTPEYFELAEQ